ncbi:unknown [Clostridium sp. CAG:448]|nr:unknown [Clostridium sp. CAG:448]
MVAHQLSEKGRIFVQHQVIKADTGTDKDPPDAGNCLDFAEQTYIFAVVYLQIFARGRRQTLAPGTDTVRQLPMAGRCAEICRGTAHIMDIPFEIRQCGQQLCLPDNGLNAAGADGSALMEGKRAEITGAEASAVMCQREAHLVDCGNAAVCFIARVIIAHVGERVHAVQFLTLQGRHRRILYQHSCAVAFADGFPVDSVLIAVLNPEGACVFRFVFLQFFIVQCFRNRIVDRIPGFTQVDRTPDVADFSDRNPAIKQGGNPQ